MESNEPKSRRRKIRIKKTKLKVIEPGIVTRKLGKTFGSFYLENHRPINIGIFLVFGIAVACILLLAMSPSNVNFKRAPTPVINKL